ncbi:hypothetical protein Bca52824_035265 [Brassica carinata]|uniref:Uncharacterized protein n=1 Tax=Brassica carinata TaxID=52824 RepID=A0A8X7S0B2_BRACI|nr:hypothetical protein Bca52824_035265 [Brassica carinata]
MSKSGSSSDPHDESGHISLAPALLSYASPIPALVSPTSSVGEKDLRNGERVTHFRHRWYSVFLIHQSALLMRGPILLALRARATLLELDRFLSSVVRWLILLAPRYCIVANYGRAADALSAKRGITGGIVSDDEVVITGSRRRMMVKVEAISSSHGKKLRERTTMRSPPQSSGAEKTPDGLSSILADLNSKVFPRDQTILSGDDPPEMIQTIQGGLLRTISQLHHLGDRLLEESPSSAREEVEKLTRELSEEVSKRVAKEMELRDLQARTKAIEGLVENSSAEALILSREKQKLEETFARLKGEIRSSEDRMTVAINGARITSRCEGVAQWTSS